MRWVDGSVYTGEWKKGIQHGQGKMKFSDGSSKEGTFENNVFIGGSNTLKNPAIIPSPIIGGSTDLSSNISTVGQRQVYSRGRSAKRVATPSSQKMSRLKENNDT